MTELVERSGLFLLVSFIAFLASAWLGGVVQRRWNLVKGDDRSELAIVQSAALTLLGLIVGFSFSMAVTRYDQRKNLEEAEANAIGTEYVRADLLPAADAARTRDLLSRYIAQRILHYQARDEARVRQINVETERLQAELWASVLSAAKTEPTIIVALAVSGMNDVLNSQGYTQAAWWNRIPIAAWVLMILIALFCNLLIGYSEH